MTSKVMDLIYWKDMERTGMVFTGLVVGLLSVFQLSIITVVSTLCLAIMCLTISIRIYYKLLHALQLGDGVHPFKTTDHTMDPAVIRANYRLLSLKQEDRPVEDHISDFLALAKVTDFPDSALVVFFRDTLHVSLRERLPPAMRDWTLHDFLEATLLVCGSPYTVGFAEKDPTSPPTVEILQPSGAPPVTPTPVCKPEPTPALASEPEVTPTRNSVPASPVAFHEPARPTSSARRRERRRASASPPAPAPVCEPEPTHVTVSELKPTHVTMSEPESSSAAVSELEPTHVTVSEPESSSATVSELEPTHVTVSEPESSPATVSKLEPSHVTVSEPEPSTVPEPAPVASTVPEPAPVASTVPEPACSLDRP
ncbi:proteoglycan 4-like isoform X1 [Xyrauchen texanus]|uniref:proteoglycan 4-like isoform X1 n=2 Tax=Xyrauchen texanus TaxID=154827 RepID=UPI002241FCED|nr:proteoglycan 4-like isoform X1 [Xyrauchen texanus]